jgi:hypothetical protein
VAFHSSSHNVRLTDLFLGRSSRELKTICSSFDILSFDPFITRFIPRMPGGAGVGGEKPPAAKLGTLLDQAE